MQTNREDVGDRYLDVQVPIPCNAKHAIEVSQPFRGYYPNLAKARDKLRSYFSSESEHHFFIGTAEEGDAIDLLAEDDGVLEEI